MDTITVRLSEEYLDRLKTLANEKQVSPEELIRATLEEWLSQPQVDFQQAAEYVLQKNAELYRRLA